MGGYDGWSLEQLKAAIFSTEPGTLSTNAGNWAGAAESTADLGTTLAKKVAEVTEAWKGLASGAFAEYMAVIEKFTAELAADQAEMGEGLTKMSMHSSSAKERATIALTPPPKTKEEKEKARKQLARILDDLAGDDRRSAESYWKAPKQAPEKLPTTGDVAPEQMAAPTAVPESPSTLDDGGAYSSQPYEPVPNAVAPPPGDGYGYDNGDATTGLAGVGGATLAPASAGTGTGLAATGLGAVGGAGALGGGLMPGVAATGLSAAGGAGAMPVGGAAGGGAMAAGRGGAGAGLFPRGRGGEDEDPDGTRTWLTEDDLEWTGEDRAAEAVVGGEGR